MHTLLHTLAKTKTVPNTLLFCGADSQEMRTAADDLARALMGPEHTLKLEKGIHPDFRLYSPQGKSGMHAMETIRALINEISLPPFESPVRLFVIEEAHRMLPTSSNALLKTLEEPTEHSYIILITSEPNTLLPTIVSRSRRIDFSTASAKIPLNPILLKLLTEPLAYADQLALFEQLEAETETAEEGHEKARLHEALLEQILTWHRDLQLVKSGADPTFLAFPEHHDALQKASQPLAWDHLLSRVETCRLALQRSIKLRTVLEHFFL